MRSLLSLRRLDNATTVLCALALAATIAVAAGGFAGRMMLVAPSDSTRPSRPAGDRLVTARVAAGTIRKGDVVTFADRARGGRLITNRVVALGHDSRGFVFKTKGDANAGDQTFDVAPGGTVQRVSSRAPGPGRTLLALARVPGWALLAAAAVVLAAPPVLRRRRSR